MQNDNTAHHLTVLRVRDGESTKTRRPFGVSKTLDANGNLITGFDAGYKFKFLRKPFADWPDCREQLDALAISRTDMLVLGEPVEWPMTRMARRTLYDKVNGDKATLRKGTTILLPFDFDGAVPPGVDALDPVADPEACVRAVVALLPAAFHDATTWWTFTSSQRRAPIAEIRLRLVFLLATPWHLTEMRRFAKTLDKRLKVDAGIYSGNQPIYLARPTIIDGDDLLPRRFGFAQGAHGRVDLLPPAVDEVAPGYGAGIGGVYLPDGEDPLQLIGDHDGGAGCYQGLLNASWHLVRTQGKTLSDEAIKALLHARVAAAEWDDKIHSRQYRANQMTDEKLDSMISGAREKLFSKQRIFHGIPPEYAAKSVPVREADRRLRECIDGALNDVVLLGSAVRLLVKAPAGIGKTTRMLTEVVKAGLTAHLFVPTHALAEEAAIRVRSLGATVQIIRGRTRDDGDPDFPKTMCVKADVVKALQAKGIISIQSHLCIRWTSVDGVPRPIKCSSFGTCDYARQFAATAQVKIYTHKTLGLPHNIFEKDTTAPDIVIVDEDPLQSLIEQHRWALADARAAGGLIADIADIITRGLPLLSELRERYDDAKEAVQEALEELDHVRLPITPAYSPELALEALRGVDAPVTFIPLLESIQEALRSGEDRFNAIWLGTDGNKTEWLHLARLRTPARIAGDDINVVMLDATPNVAAWREVLPDLHVEEIHADRNAVVVQAFDRTLSKTSLADGQRGATLTRDLIGLVGAAAEHFGSVGVCGPKVIIDKMREALAAEIEKGSLKVANFGGLRGVDRLKESAIGIVIGRNLPDAFDVEAQARAIWPFEKMSLTGKYIQRPAGYRMRSGEPVGVVIFDHDDPRVRSVLRQVREAESEQALDRHRLLHRVEPKLILLLSDLPLDVDVDHLVEFEDVVGRKGLAAKLCSFGGVLPLGAEWLQKHAGFDTRKSAEGWARKVLRASPVIQSKPANFYKGDEKTAQNPQTSIRDQNPQTSLIMYRELRVLTWRLVEYRVKGESGRPSRAATCLTALADIQQRLVELHGQEVRGVFWADGHMPATLLTDGDPVKPIQDYRALPMVSVMAEGTLL